jgi:hypothetical protein
LIAWHVERVPRARYGRPTEVAALTSIAPWTIEFTGFGITFVTFLSVLDYLPSAYSLSPMEVPLVPVVLSDGENNQD